MTPTFVKSAGQLLLECSIWVCLVVSQIPIVLFLEEYDESDITFSEHPCMCVSVIFRIAETGYPTPKT